MCCVVHELTYSNPLHICCEFLFNVPHICIMETMSFHPYTLKADACSSVVTCLAVRVYNFFKQEQKNGTNKRQWNYAGVDIAKSACAKRFTADLQIAEPLSACYYSIKISV